MEFSAGLPTPSQVSLDVLKQTFEVNYFGTVPITQAMLPLIHKADAGRIVNVSSDMASLTLHQDLNFKFKEKFFLAKCLRIVTLKDNRYLEINNSHNTQYSNLEIKND